MLLIAVVVFNDSFAQPADNQPVNQLTLADPTIFFWEGKYYAFGTGGRGSNNGIPVYESTGLANWEPILSNDGYALRKGDAFGTKGFWAPQVFHLNGVFYMAYTANEQIAIATSKQPGGPYTQQNAIALPAAGKQIDPFVFIDDDGKKYLYHVRLFKGNRIYGAELKNDLSGIVDSTAVECISASEHWENTGDSSWPVTEGPTVIKKAGKYYMFYSANDIRNPDYAVGMASSDHPLGPWKKVKGNPVLSRKQTGQNGTGHGDLLKSKDGVWYYVFHTHQSSKNVAPRKTMMIPVKIKGNRFVFENEKAFPLLIK